MIYLANINANSSESFLKIYSLSNDYNQSKVWSGYFIAPNGEVFNTSNYYKNTKNEFHINGEFFFINLKRKHTVGIPFYYDNGYESSLFKAKEKFDLGLSVSGILSDSIVYGISATSLLQFGGDLNEYPCVDSFNREFHCGTGIPWTDSSSILINDKLNRKIRFKIQYLF